MKNIRIDPRYILTISLFSIILIACNEKAEKARIIENFNSNWRFILNDSINASKIEFNDSTWRMLDLPHDWSIEGEFSEDNPAGVGGGALPGGIGWYRKSFKLAPEDSGKMIYIHFDGVYQNSEVYVNGNLLGKRPYGYISFRYDLTPYLKFGNEENVISVKVDNSNQPNSRWYSGSGIYRNVWLLKLNKVHVDLWGSYITTPNVTEESADVLVELSVRNTLPGSIYLEAETQIFDDQDKVIASGKETFTVETQDVAQVKQRIVVEDPKLWSDVSPVLYNAVTKLYTDGKIIDKYETAFGIRYFEFDAERGFFLNGKHTKIRGVCNHHDLGCLGAAINTRAIERQLEILREMGCNGIRTSHNPPAPELLDLCDKMGFIVMDETFDMWKKNKVEFGYGLYWDDWHAKDLTDHILRDRNHPSVIMWSVGNEILEQWDTSGIRMTKELVGIVKNLDSTRPVTTGNNFTEPDNNLIKSGVLDLIGFNYAHEKYADFPKNCPGKKFISSETASALMTRGHYDMPSDSIRRWPYRWDVPFTDGNPNNTVSAYDNVSAPWGSTHEEAWSVIKKYDHIAGLYIWTGIDYLGEPTPYSWPSRSSYFGIIDLAGFPKDVYYMYQSEWTNKDVLHIFPHWNWELGQNIDVIAYTNCDEVELFLNDSSLGAKKMKEEDLKLVWNLDFVPGSIKAVGRRNGEIILEKEIHTAGEPASIVLEADRTKIKADGNDLVFITATVVDKDDNMVPDANNLINFEVEGNAKIIGVDNGNQTSHEPFNVNYRKAFNGKCLVVVKAGSVPGTFKLKATGQGDLKDAVTIITMKSL